jgi:hypothetical protein
VSVEPSVEPLTSRISAIFTTHLTTVTATNSYLKSFACFCAHTLLNTRRIKVLTLPLSFTTPWLNLTNTSKSKYRRQPAPVIGRRAPWIFGEMKMRRADGIHAARLPTPSVLSTMARMGTLGLLVRLGFALDGETCLSCFGNEMM